MSDTNQQSSPAQALSESPVFHAPRANLQALLDQLSDSEDELSRPAYRRVVSKPIVASSAEQESGSSDDEVVLGGRLAARLAGDAPQHAQMDVETAAKSSEKAEERSTKASLNPTRKLLRKRKRTAKDDASSTASSPKRSSLGLDERSSGSRTPEDAESSAIDQLASSSPQSSSQPKSKKPKFFALVEKIRRERLAREAEDQAKQDAREAKQQAIDIEVERIVQAATKSRGQRGSSPADDSEEDSDASEGAAARKLTRDARPTRKASKKALEEMHRETQRMNRNMQLAHQAKTKKKFTKEDFFAKFNKTELVLPIAVESRKQRSSSPVTTDIDNGNIHSTPPTSPLSGIETATKMTNVSVIHDETVDPAADNSDEDFLNLIRNRKEEVQVAPPVKVAPISNIQLQLSKRALLKLPQEDDSDSDVEIVFDKGSRRKYSAFENIPKKKAQENSAHLALRSLAQVKREKDKKSTMTSVGMYNNLRKGAIEQALAERKAKIEKLRAAGVVIQTEEQREQAEEELEDLVEKARQEDEEIRKREKEMAKKQGTYVKDVDEESDEEDSDFVEEHQSGSEDEQEASADEDEDAEVKNALFDEATEESEVEGDSEAEAEPEVINTSIPTRSSRISRVVIDDDDEEEEDDEPALPLSTVQVPQSPSLPSTRKTPQSIMRSVRKVIPGLPHSDDLPIGLTQAFAATMADSQTQATQEDSLQMLEDLPSPNVEMAPRLNRYESLDLITESVVGTQTQPFDLELGLSQSQVPKSPSTQADFIPTQDQGYKYSPFIGNKYAESPLPHSTEETVILQESPIVRRRRQQVHHDSDGDDEEEPVESAFKIMKKAAKRKLIDEFKKKDSAARNAFDEDAEESDDEYAGLGGASDDDEGEENEDDRQMIDEDTQVGKGDAATLAKLHADRERAQDEQAVNKLYKDITTGGLRRKRGVANDLDLSDEEDAAARRREAKRREYNKMRRELFKDEAVNKIADDEKKQAFLKSIEDQEEDEDDFDRPETRPEEDSQSQTEPQEIQPQPQNQNEVRQPLRETNLPRRVTSRKPTNLAEIRESLSFLIEDTESQALDLGISDPEEELESYVNLDRHLEVSDDENNGMADFIVDDAPPLKRAPFNERRTQPVIDRMSLLQQKSSSASGKMAFVPRISSMSSMRKNTLIKLATNTSMSSTGVVTAAERGKASQDRVVVRKASDTAKNSINWQGRKNLAAEKMSERAGVKKKKVVKKGGFLQGLFAGGRQGFD